MTNKRQYGGESTRRTFMKLTGAGFAAAGLGLSGTAAAARKNGWSTVESGTGKTLYDAVSTLEGPYAVGGGESSPAVRRAGNRS
jgi:hypothetical protein